MQRRLPAHLSVAEVQVAARGVVRVEASQFRRGEYESDVAKGSIDATIRTAKRPKLSLRLNLAGRAFSDPLVQTAYFPTTGAMGMEGASTGGRGST